MSPERHNDLAVHCARKNIPYVPFITFDQVQQVVQELVEGKVTVEGINKGQGFDNIMKNVQEALATKGKEVPRPAVWQQ